MAETRSDCPCPRAKCPRRQDCTACREHHYGEGTPPYCERDQKGKRNKRTKRDR